MITDNIINWIFLPFYGLVCAIGSLTDDLTLPANIYEIFYNISSGVGYLLPVSLITFLIGIQLSLHAFRFTWYLIIRAKSFIPFSGGA